MRPDDKLLNMFMDNLQKTLAVSESAAEDYILQFRKKISFLNCLFVVWMISFLYLDANGAGMIYKFVLWSLLIVMVSYLGSIHTRKRSAFWLKLTETNYPDKSVYLYNVKKMIGENEWKMRYFLFLSLKVDNECLKYINDKLKEKEDYKPVFNATYRDILEKYAMNGVKIEVNIVK